MHAPAGRLVFITFVLSLAAPATARFLPQQLKESKEPSGTVAGRVTIGGKPAANLTVMLTLYESYSNEQPVSKGSTDEDGRFRLTRVPAGRYYVRPFAPAFTYETEDTSRRSEKSVTLSDGEAVDGINIALKRGGVITGRVTDASGRPLVEEQVRLQFTDDHNRAHPFYQSNFFALRTDDRGVYRLYGLPAGRYLVSAGLEQNNGMVRMGFGNRYYPRTFHPGVTDESKATAVELAQGGEATGVDIVVGRVEKTYTATGRIIDADTGKPLADIGYGYGPLRPDEKMMGARGWGYRSNAKGEIRLDGLFPGRYAVFATTGEGSEYYNEPTMFEITDADVSGVEMKLRRGSAISGTVVIEGTSNQDILTRLQALNLYVSILTQEVNHSGGSNVKINPDGSFTISGLWAGKAQFHLDNWGWGPNRKFSLLRVELDGQEQREGIEIRTGENISGVKVIIAYSTGIIRGQVKIEGMDYPEDAHLSIQARRVGEAGPDRLYTEADARGRFVLEGVASGEYELAAEGFIGRATNSQVRLKRTVQVVTVANGAEVEVTLTLKPDSKDR
jgi:Carboxypeptidase regulatory-like domain